MCCGFVLICVLSLFIVTDGVEIAVGVSDEEILILCDHYQTNKISVTVLEGKPLTLRLVPKQETGTQNGNYFKECKKADEENIIFASDPSITITTATREMSTKWKCLIQSPHETECYFNVHVRLENSPLKILINNMVVPIHRTPHLNSSYDHIGVYNYSDGDKVKVNCIVEDNSAVTDDITLSYRRDGRRENEITQDFKVTLGGNHNYTILCTYKNDHEFTIVKLIFEKKEFDDAGYIEVNGVRARKSHDSLNKYNAGYFTLDYIFFSMDPVSVSCNTNINAYSVGPTDKCKNSSRPYEQSIQLTSEFICIVCNYSFEAPIYKFQVNIKLPLRTKIDSTTTIRTEIAGASPTGTSPIGTSPAGTKATNWPVIIIGVLMGAILIAVGIVICKMKMRKQKVHQTKPTEANETPQHTNLTTPQIEHNDISIYAEPYVEKNDFKEEESYAVPIPKSQRKPKANEQLEVNYATPCDSVDNSLYCNTAESPYAEVTGQAVYSNGRKNSQELYGNVFSGSCYVNTEASVYAEATYSKPKK